MRGDLQLDPAAPMQVWQVSPQVVTLRFGTEQSSRYVVEWASDAVEQLWSSFREVIGTGQDVELQVQAESKLRYFRMRKVEASF